jgi:hypothetical protein
MTKSDDESFRALIEANVRGWKGLFEEAETVFG